MSFIPNPVAILRRTLMLPLWVLFGIGGGKAVGDGIPTLRLMSYQLHNARDPNAPLLEMQGRYPGWRSRVLGMFGLMTKPYIRVTGKELRLITSTISGTTHLVVPLSDITSASCSIEKPARNLYLALASALIGIGLTIYFLSTETSSDNTNIQFTLGIGLGLAVILVFSYWRSNRLLVAFSTANIDNAYGMAFRSGKASVNYDKLANTIHVINRTVARAHMARADRLRSQSE